MKLTEPAQTLQVPSKMTTSFTGNLTLGQIANGVVCRQPQRRWTDVAAVHGVDRRHIKPTKQVPVLHANTESKRDPTLLLDVDSHA